ncbi:hypothetical protein Hamer_G029470 [Homarus americanus]|uniref:Secreted protein n=1 Tax=Homarus americanus TaxID=6706 RepID=A0A8J5T7B9_HOMAM|nr:hypothetical protein Hamer_G029470 [Homarus americanus]
MLPGVMLLIELVIMTDANHGIMWHPRQVSPESPTTGSSATLNVYSEINCAMKAAETEWSHMYTYKDNTCTLYKDESNLGDATIPCKTRNGQNLEVVIL